MALPSLEPWEALIDCTSVQRTSDTDVFAGSFCTKLPAYASAERQSHTSRLSKLCLPSLRHRLSAHYIRAANRRACTHARTHPISLATYKCSFLRNRFLPEVVSIFHVPKRLGELLAGGAGEITGLSGGQHRVAALSFRQDNMGVKDGSWYVSARSHCRETVIPQKATPSQVSTLKNIVKASKVLARFYFLKVKRPTTKWRHFFSPHISQQMLCCFRKKPAFCISHYFFPSLLFLEMFRSVDTVF